MLKKMYELFEENFVCLLFLLIFFLMVVGVILRYVFGISFAWNIELVRYSFVWLTFIGAAFARKTDSHIKIDLFSNFVKRSAPRWVYTLLWLFTKAVIIVFLLLLVYFSVNLSIRSWRFKSQAMQISQSFLYISVGIGTTMYVVREIVDSVLKIKRGDF